MIVNICDLIVRHLFKKRFAQNFEYFFNNYDFLSNAVRNVVVVWNQFRRQILISSSKNAKYHSLSVLCIFIERAVKMFTNDIGQ